MSVIIRGAKMPMNCHECNALGYSDIVGVDCSEYRFDCRASCCPLVEADPEWSLQGELSQLLKTVRNAVDIAIESLEAEPTPEGGEEEMNRSDILRKAEQIINGERQEQYGDAKNNFSMIAALWSDYLGIFITPRHVADMMILLKIARNKEGEYKEDNFVDICGYAALGGELSDDSLSEANGEEEEKDENAVDVKFPEILIREDATVDDIKRCCDVVKNQLKLHGKISIGAVISCFAEYGLISSEDHSVLAIRNDIGSYGWYYDPIDELEFRLGIDPYRPYSLVLEVNKKPVKLS